MRTPARPACPANTDADHVLAAALPELAASAEDAWAVLTPIDGLPSRIPDVEAAG